MADNLDMYKLDETGEMIFTAHFLSKKGRCCKSTCLHCPYGHTLTKINIEFRAFDNNLQRLEDVLIENEYNKPVSIADQLLASNLGSKRKQLDIKSVPTELIRLMFLKNYFMGFVVVENNKVSKFFLGKQFQFQNIDLHTVQEHYSKS